MELYTRKQTAEIFGIKVKTLWTWEKKDILKPIFYVNGRPRYSMQDIQNVPTETNKNLHNQN